MAPFAGMGDVIYRTVFRRTSTFLLAVVAGGFFFERSFDKIGDTIFEKWNKGDIKHKYENKQVEEAAAAEEE